MLDRIDIHIEVPRVDYEKLSGDRMRESSEAIRAKVQAARDIQQNDLDCKVSRLCAEAMRLRTPSSATPICALGRFGSFASCRMKALW